MKRQLLGQIQKPGQRTENIQLVVDERPILTNAEKAAGIQWVNGDYEAGDILRYGFNSAPGTTDMTAAVQAALSIDQKRVFSDTDEAMLVTTELTSTIADRVIEGLNLTTDGSILAADYVLVTSGARTKIKDVTCAGIPVTTDCGGIFVSGIETEINGCKFTDLDNGGGLIINSAATGSIAVNNYLDNCAPVVLGGSQYGSIHCNADNCLISNNRITDNGQTGISSNGADFLGITNNYIEGKTTGSTSGGIILDGNNVGCVIDSNVINGCRVEGIQVAGSLATYTTPSRDHVISNNTIKDAIVSGITLFASDAGALINCTVTGNNIKYESATNRAIEINRASDCNISGNYVNGYNIGLNVVNASPGFNVTGNTFENQDSTGIQVYGQYWLVSGNRVIGDGVAGSTTGIIFNAPSFAGDQLIVGNQVKDCLVGLTGTFSGSQRTFVQSNHFIDCGTDTSYTSSNTNSSTNNIPSGAAIAGTFTLVAGAATVANTELAAGDRILLSKVTAGGTAGAVYVNARTDGTSFTVASTDAADTSTYSYEFIR